MKLELTPRLALLASWVPPGPRLIDVGTDHGYLPAWLIQNGRIEEAIASDLRPGPLSRAEDTARRCGVEEKMRLRLCPGLSAIRPEEGDTIAIAGMGGENIAMILSAAPWTADGQHTLLLQPQSRSEVLRRFLQDRGYRILRERLVWDRGILYPVLEARGGEMRLDEGRLLAGACIERDPLGDRHLITLILRDFAALSGLLRAGAGEGEKAESLRREITHLITLREEWRHANGTSN